MPELSHIDPRSAALLVMDYQVGALTRSMTAAQSADAIARVPGLIATARDAGMMVIHVVVAFRPGHPEVSPRNSVFSVLKANGMLVAGSEGVAIHPAAAAREGGTDRGQAPHQPVRWHRPGDAAERCLGKHKPT
jgi:nicotinamidase-related amidase